jgi:hypothetical protein
MLKIRSGVIKKVLTDEQYEMIKNEEILSSEIDLIDTVRTTEHEDGTIVQYLPFRVSFKEVDPKGNEKYIYNDESDEYVLSYKTSPILCAFSKEMRIILEMKEYTPIKVVVEEFSESKKYKVLCVQNQLSGKLD